MDAPSRTGCLAILAFLLVLPAVGQAGNPEKGKGIYSSRCAFCHGVTGKGDGPAGATLKPPPTNLTTLEFWQGATPQTLKRAIETGKPGTAMVSFRSTLTPDEIDDLIAYLGSFKPQS